MTWLRVLLVLAQALAWPSLLAMAWTQERAELEAYEKTSAISPAEEEAEFRAAEAYDAKWQAEDRERNRELGTGPGL
jgi:hypothetical protein